MNAHTGKRPAVVLEATNAPGDTALVEACEWSNAVGVTLSVTGKSQRAAFLDLTWIELDALIAAVSMLRAGGAE